MLLPRAELILSMTTGGDQLGAFKELRQSRRVCSEGRVNGSSLSAHNVGGLSFLWSSRSRRT